MYSYSTALAHIYIKIYMYKINSTAALDHSRINPSPASLSNASEAQTLKNLRIMQNHLLSVL